MILKHESRYHALSALPINSFNVMHAYRGFRELSMQRQNALQRHRPLNSGNSIGYLILYYYIEFELDRVRAWLADAMVAPLLFVFALRAVAVASQAHNLTFMMIVSYGQHGFNSSGALPAVDMALEDINSDPDVLSGHNLMYDKVRDSMVSIYSVKPLYVCLALPWHGNRVSV
jgi:hypothetical protein